MAHTGPCEMIQAEKREDTVFQGMVLSHVSAEGMAHSPKKTHSSFSEDDEP